MMVACIVDGVGERALMKRNVDCVQAAPLAPGCSDCKGSQGGAGVGKGAKGLTNMLSISCKDQDHEARKAAGAWSEALRMLRPPWMLGRDNLSHDQSDMGPPRLASRASRILWSNSIAARQMWLGGQVRSMKETLGRVRHE